MASIIQRDTNNTPQKKKGSKKNGHFLDTILLYVVGFFGLFGSIYLLYLSNEPTVQFTNPTSTSTSLYINDLKMDDKSGEDSSQILNTAASVSSKQ